MTMHDANTKANGIAWYRDIFGFTLTVSTALYDEQLLENKKTLAELNDSDIDNICRKIWCNPNRPIAKVAATQLELANFWIKHQD
jgi:hypothetical protein